MKAQSPLGGGQSDNRSNLRSNLFARGWNASNDAFLRVSGLPFQPFQPTLYNFYNKELGHSARLQNLEHRRFGWNGWNGHKKARISAGLSRSNLSQPFQPLGRDVRVGEANALFLADLAANTPDVEMRRRWNEHYYGKPDERPPIDFVKGWRKFHGRT